MSARTNPKTRDVRAAAVDVHAVVREVLVAKRDAIVSAGQHVTLELNARKVHARGEHDMVHDLVAHGLESVLAPAVRGDRLVVTTTSDESQITLRMAVGSRVFETELSTVNAERQEPASAPKSPPAMAPSAPVIAGARTVLVVDDDMDTVALLRWVLEHRGYEVLGATSVAEALLVAGKRPFDVLISDVGLPDGSGIDLMDRLGRPRHAIALTGVSSDEDVARIRAAGFRQHLTKPVNLSTLEAAISELLKSA
ncbi:MAG TPA: response regulator [Polyangiaceae bacterium]|nr:response regulator [Polyangiaceae bacterium]